MKLRPFAFFALTLLFSAPFWVLGDRTGAQLLPGIPISALMVIAPTLAAVALVWRDARFTAAMRLLGRSFDYARIHRVLWLAPAFFLMPALISVTYFAMRATGAAISGSAPNWSALPLLALIFFLSATAEEIGFSGYATRALQERMNALSAALLLGLFWAVWHLIPFLQAHRGLEWAFWHGVATIATRVLIVWLFVNTGHSVFATSLMHATANMAYFALPGFGVSFDARLNALVLAAAAVLVAARWRPNLLVSTRS